MSYNIKNDGLEIKTKDGVNIKGFDIESIEIKEHDSATRSFWAVGSTENPDRSNDVISQNGWSLDRYKSAPRGLWMHNMRELPVFRSLDIQLNNGKLLFRPSFDTHEKADIIYNQYINGFLSDFSVGFIPGEWKFRNEDDKWGGGINFLKGHELLEISCVTVPDNPEAQRLGLFGEQNELYKMGYTGDSGIIKGTSDYWNPIYKDLDAFYAPELVVVSNGINAITAKTKDESQNNSLVIGYSFNTNMYGTDFIQDWMKVYTGSQPVYKYYIYTDSVDNVTLNVIEEEVKESDTKIVCLDDMSPDENGNCPMEDNSSCDHNKGCGRKPKKSVEEEVEKDINNDISIKDLKIILDNFDKASMDNINCLLKDVRESIDELKKFFTELIDMVKNNSLKTLPEENNSIELDLSGFSPVSREKSDSEEFEIDMEEIKQISNSPDTAAKIEEQLTSIFEDTLREFSGKLNDN